MPIKASSCYPSNTNAKYIYLNSIAPRVYA